MRYTSCLLVAYINLRRAQPFMIRIHSSTLIYNTVCCLGFRAPNQCTSLSCSRAQVVGPTYLIHNSRASGSPDDLCVCIKCVPNRNRTSSIFSNFGAIDAIRAAHATHQLPIRANKKTHTWFMFIASKFGTTASIYHHTYAPCCLSIYTYNIQRKCMRCVLVPAALAHRHTFRVVSRAYVDIVCAVYVLRANKVLCAIVVRRWAMIFQRLH